MSDKDYSLTKEKSNETIESWSRRSYIGQELQAKLAKADALIVPYEGYGEKGDVHYFPEGTEHLISFLQRNNHGDQHIDICIEDSDYKELAEHHDLLIIAGAIATSVCAPILVNLVSEYIKQRLGSRTNDATLKTSLTISDDKSGESVSFTYEGPASTYEKAMLVAIKDGGLEEGELPPTVKRINVAPDIKVDNESK
jgi:hypothetical protein